MGPIGAQEMIFIFILALLLFGPKKLPELARMLGKGLSEFRRAKNELTSTFQSHMQELERESRMEEASKNAALSPAVTPAPNPYAYSADEYGQISSGYEYPAEQPVVTHAIEPASDEPVSQAVSGSIPRTNGVQPLTVPVHSNGDHSPERKDEHPA